MHLHLSLINLSQVHHLVDESEDALGVATDIKLNGEIAGLLTENAQAKAEILDYDFAVYLDKDKYLGKALEKQGLRLFNRAEQIEICDDKMHTYLALSKQNITFN